MKGYYHDSRPTLLPAAACAAIAEAAEVAEQVKLWAYDASADLTAEKGPFPAFEAARHLVAYLQAADNVASPHPFRLCRVHQPVISPPNVFSRTRSPLLGCI